LPSAAIVDMDNKHYVFTADGKEKEDYRFHMVEVSVGIVDENYTEIILPSTVKPTSDFVLKGAYDLMSARTVSEEEHSH
jgi:hypothetical protein